MIHLSRFDNVRNSQWIEPRVPPAGLSLVKEIATKHRIHYQRLLGKERNKSLCKMRDEAYYHCRAHGRLSFPAIGKLFQRHHTTIMAGVKRHIKRTTP